MWKICVGALTLVLLLTLSSMGCRTAEKQKSPDVSTMPVQHAPMVSGKNTRVYHLRECLYARDIPDQELLGFATSDEAAATGRIPCAQCRPDKVVAAAPPHTSDEALPDPPLAPTQD